MFKKLKLWYAQLQLQRAVAEEELLRNDAKRLREVVIPQLEKESRNAELDVRVANFLNGERK